MIMSTCVCMLDSLFAICVYLYISIGVCKLSTINIKKPSKLSTKIPNKSKYDLSTNTTYLQPKLEINHKNGILASKSIAIKTMSQTKREKSKCR